VGQSGSIAIIERAIRTIKGIASGLWTIPRRREEFRRELQYILEWYNEHRPHATLVTRPPKNRWTKTPAAAVLTMESGKDNVPNHLERSLL